MSGPVVFKVANGTYNENVHLFTIPGTSSKNNILFESASGDSSKVIITFPGSIDSSGKNGFINFALFFEDVSYISVSKMTIQRTGIKNVLQQSDVVLIEGGDYDSLNNCRILCNRFPSQITSTGINIKSDAKGNASKNIFIHGNLVLHGNPPVSISGSATNTYVILDQNIFDSSSGSSGGGGIFANGINTLLLTKNYFDPGFRGIYTNYISNLEISKNIINAKIQSDMDGSVSSPVLISNNEFIGQGATGINLGQDGYVNIYYNTFYNPSGQLDFVPKPTVNFLNNLIFDSLITNDSNWTPILAGPKNKLDYNDYEYYLYPTNYFGYDNGTFYSSFKTWQTGSGNDLHSQTINPGFISKTNLEPKNTAMNFGTPIAGITTDINGNPRDPKHPTVGAFNVAHISDTTMCKNSCAIFTAPISGTSYHWSTSQTTQSIKYCPTTSGPVWVTVRYGSAISDSIQFQFYVTVTNSTCVWPGDANDDGKVDMNDLLSVGVAYSYTGSKRSNASDNWYAQSCNDWSKSFTTGVNYKNADCDGNGVVDSSDLSVIALNYSKTHLKTAPVASGNPSDPPLNIVFSKDSALAGDTVQAIINLGSKAIPASNVYGLALSVGYGAAAPAKYYSADFSNSWLGTYHKNMVSLIVNDSDNQIINIGITRTDHNNASGYGQIGVLSITMPDNLAGKREVKQYIKFNIESYKAISANENDVPLNPTGDSILVYEYKNSGIAPYKFISSDFKIYPNPANNILHVKTNSNPVNMINIEDVLGNIVYASITSGAQQVDLPISTLSKGIYIINISTTKGMIRSKFVKE